jgi:hypothetical protein
MKTSASRPPASPITDPFGAFDVGGGGGIEVGLRVGAGVDVQSTSPALHKGPVRNC